MKHIHFIGICGVGMGALAVLWQKKGWKVTGSDVGFYPPVSTHLKNHHIKYYAGWHPEKIGVRQTPSLISPLKGGENETMRPDLVIVGNVAGSENPELNSVLENNIPHLTYPQLIEQNLLKTNSIVVAGTFGKTSTTALLAKIFIDAGLNPAYMFGAVATDLDMSADDLGGDYSIIEGDEYKAGRTDLGAKFFHYHPTHLLLTATEWDHADVYPTEQSYLEAFKKLLADLPKNGILVVSEKVPSVISNPNGGEKSLPRYSDQLDRDSSSAAVGGLARNDGGLYAVTYGQSPDCDYQYFDVQSTKSGLSFKIKHRSQIFNLQSPALGEYMADNITGAFALSEQFGIRPDEIIESIKKFHGIKRRLEKRGVTKNDTTIFDDIAHSPAKARAVLATLKKIYPGKIIAVFEPNTGNRQPQSAPSYANAFSNATEVIIPRLTKIKSDEKSKHWTGEELTKIISATQPAAKYLEDDNELVNYLIKNTGPDDCIVFLGSHGFRGMIEETLNPKL